jgi:hypothetical protein
MGIIRLLSMSTTQKVAVDEIDKLMSSYVDHFVKLYLYGESRQPVNENNHWEFEIGERTADIYMLASNLKPGKRKLSEGVLAKVFAKHFDLSFMKVREWYRKPSYQNTPPFLPRSSSNFEKMSDALNAFFDDGQTRKMARELLACQSVEQAEKLGYHKWCDEIVKLRDQVRR